jgi:chemotaxis protein MotB
VPGTVPPTQTLDLQQRTAALDANNRELHTQLAQSKQQTDLLRQQVSLLQKQLGDSAQRLQAIQAAKDQAEKKFEALEASTTRRSGAVITANNSLHQALRPIEISGLEIRQDEGLIRIEIPADQLFAPGTAQVVGTAYPILDRVASELARNYPRQLIAIEGHTDSMPAAGGITNHQLSAAQALAVFDQLTRRNRLPSQQLFLVAEGANRPRESNATQAGQARNRRIELVIHPATFDES